MFDKGRLILFAGIAIPLGLLAGAALVWRSLPPNNVNALDQGKTYADAGNRVEPQRDRAGFSTDATLVRAVGRKFQWHFVFPGPDKTFDTPDDVQSGTTLHLPLGSEVDLQLTSDDYVYIMTLPEYGLSEIAVPDMLHHLRFKADRCMDVPIRTDPMCGVAFLHDDEMGEFKIEPIPQFFRWVDAIQHPRL